PTLCGESGQMRRGRRNAGLELDVVDDVDTEATREVWPGIVVGDEFRSRKCDSLLAPRSHSLRKCGDESVAIGDDKLARVRLASDQRLGNAAGDDHSVLRVQPIVWVGRSVRVPCIARDALTAHIKQWDSGGAIDVARGAAHQARIASGNQQSVEPRIVTEADPGHDIGALELVQVTRPRLERLGVFLSRNQGFDADLIAAYSARQSGQVGRGRYNSNGRRGRA